MMVLFVFCLCFFGGRLKGGKFFKKGSMLSFALIDFSEGVIDVIELLAFVVNSQAFCFSNSLIFPLLLELVQFVEDSLAFLE